MLIFSWFQNPFQPFITIGIYLASLYLLKNFMKSKEPLKGQLNYLFALHNFFLYGLSFVMTVGLTIVLVKIYLNHGALALYCGTDDVEANELYFWTNIFYVSKYYELLDTYFLVFRKRELTLLHVWHHAIVVIVCHFANEAEIFMGWTTCFNNSLVHIFMYYYYALQVTFF